MVENLQQLAKYLEIEDFDLDLELLDTYEGRQEIKRHLKPLGVEHLDIVQKLADIESDEILRRQLLQQAQCVVRVYMISGYDFASRDAGGFSDPYLVLRIGSKKISESKNY